MRTTGCRSGVNPLIPGVPAIRFVQDFPQQNRQRPSVQNQVMNRPDQSEVSILDPKQGHPKQRRMLKVETLDPIPVEEFLPPRLLGRGSETTPVLLMEFPWDLGMNALNRRIDLAPTKPYPESVVSLDQAPPSAPKPSGVHLLGQIAHQLQHVPTALRMRKSMEQHSLLQRAEGIIGLGHGGHRHSTRGMQAGSISGDTAKHDPPHWRLQRWPP